MTWAFAGEITNVYDPMNFLGGSIQAGTIITGTYSFESTTPGDGIYHGAIVQLSGQVGKMSFEKPVEGFDRIFVDDNVKPLGFDNYLAEADALFANQATWFQLGMRDFSGTMLTSNQLLIEPPLVANIDPEFSGISLGYTKRTAWHKCKTYPSDSGPGACDVAVNVSGRGWLAYCAEEILELDEP